MYQSERRIWHGLPGDASLAPEPGGRQIKSPVAIRTIALKQSAESSATHPRFRCPGCLHWFLLTYGRPARTAWPQEYEHWCIDCIRDLDLDVLLAKSHKKLTGPRGISLLDK